MRTYVHLCGHDYLQLHMCAAHDAVDCSTFVRIWEINADPVGNWYRLAQKKTD
jgi:hypothetical protein